MVIEIQGFFIRKKFYVRELGACGRNETKSHQKYKIPFRKKELDSDDQRIIFLHESQIHGLSFHCKKGENAHEQECLEQDVLDLYHSAKSETCDIVAYRGGQPEKELLTKLKIPNIDLSDFGCAKVECLAKIGYRLLGGCEFHRVGLSTCCAFARCRFLREWVTDFQKRTIRFGEIRID